MCVYVDLQQAELELNSGTSKVHINFPILHCLHVLDILEK